MDTNNKLIIMFIIIILLVCLCTYCIILISNKFLLFRSTPNSTF